MNVFETNAQYLADLADGEWVWCGFADREARTADGFCQFCGSTEHAPTATPFAANADYIGLAEETQS